MARKYLDLLGPLDWANFPERDPHRAWPGPTPASRAPFVASYLVKLHEDKVYMSDLRDYLVEHPALVWVLGFPLKPSDQFPWGFAVEASLPTARRFGRDLRALPNDALQFLLDGAVYLLRQELPPDVRFGEAISLDTKHILAWVAENNPKAYILESDRLTKTRQPKGDPDCKLGCKKKRNEPTDEAKVETAPAKPATPTKNPRRVTNFSSSDVYYWGYAYPLLFPTPTGESCPLNHKNWPKGGCLTTMATSIGARLRYQLDRDSDQFNTIYKQRAATERINSQATEIGIEEPRLRNRRAITNQDTLIYVLINLRGLQRVRACKAELAAYPEAPLSRN